MKVLKFGGTSVGSVESILNLKAIVEACDEPVIVVVSALGGITDQLIATGKMAVCGDKAYMQSFNEIVDRHHKMIETIITDADKRNVLLADVDELLNQLKSIYQSLYLIKDLTDKIHCAMVSYGERISSRIVATLINDTKWYSSLDFIKTKEKAGKNLFSNTLSAPLIKDAFAEFVEGKSTHKVCLVGGFISTDAQSGDITNLGRGGSDYTAAILAAVLDADILEIWTDVSGFMTADPRVISTAYPIEKLSYVEATELCNFGAKVVYPPTIYPVCKKNIPIVIKNTFAPQDPGTLISEDAGDSQRAIKGISSMKNTSLITVSGLSMVGTIGVSQRIYTALGENSINVVMASQASSENNISIGVSNADADNACAVLNREFEKEIELGKMERMIVEKDLATVAIVGSNMKNTPGIAGRLFGTLGRNGISIISCAQGASETNISFVIDSRDLRKCMHVIHDAFFLSEHHNLNVFLCGTGTVGGTLLEQLAEQQQALLREHNLNLQVVGVADDKNVIFEQNGIDLNKFDINTFREKLKSAKPSTIQVLHDEILGMNMPNAVFVDCTASKDVATLYHYFLNNSISVVAANKIAASGDLEHFKLLKETAHKRDVKYLFETNVGAGLPIINTINALRTSGDKILKIEAVLSGTLNYIFNTISADCSFSEAVRRAKEERFSEPDPRIDLSGVDVIRKLVILSRESGYDLSQEDVEKLLFVPNEMFEGTLDDFWKNLPSLDAEFEKMRQEVETCGEHLRFVAKLENGKGSVSLQRVGVHHPFYNLEGSNNIVLLQTARYNQHPMQIQGYGAGAGVTAAGVFADIMSIANV